MLFAAVTARSGKGREERLGAARVERVRLARNHLDLRRVLARLGELEVNDVLVEAGPKLAGALLSAGLVDEWLLYVAPKLLGDKARPLATLGKLTRMAAARPFDVLESTTLGPDLRLRLQPRGQ